MSSTPSCSPQRRRQQLTTNVEVHQSRYAPDALDRRAATGKLATKAHSLAEVSVWLAFVCNIVLNVLAIINVLCLLLVGLVALYLQLEIAG